MEKINFTNNSAPAINATNLNAIQTNTENAIGVVNNSVTTLSGTVAQKIDKASMVVLTGTIAITLAPGEISGTATINYPSGFTKSNCVVISSALGGLQNVHGYNDYLSYGYYADNSTATLNGAMLRNIILKDSNIELAVYLTDWEASSTTTQNFPYKIVLMKIS